MVMSVFLTVSLSMDRYLSVVHPVFAIQNHCMSSTLFLATPSLLFSFLFTLPNYFLLTTQLENKNKDDTEQEDLTANHYQEIHNEMHHSGGLRLVWASWRDNKAFTTVRKSGKGHGKLWIKMCQAQAGN